MPSALSLLSTLWPAASSLTRFFQVVAIFLVPVLVMSAFGSLIWFPWSRPSEEKSTNFMKPLNTPCFLLAKEPKPGEKKVEIDFSDLRDM